MMRVRLRLLLTSFNKSVLEYALARLELALEHPTLALPPVIDRIGPQVRLDDELAERWPATLAQVHAATSEVAEVGRRPVAVRRGLTWTRLVRALRLIRQFAQSIEAVGTEFKRNAAGDHGG